jgi:hypothetical protein
MASDPSKWNILQWFAWKKSYCQGYDFLRTERGRINVLEPFEAGFGNNYAISEDGEIFERTWRRAL